MLLDCLAERVGRDLMSIYNLLLLIMFKIILGSLLPKDLLLVLLLLLLLLSIFYTCDWLPFTFVLFSL